MGDILKAMLEDVLEDPSRNTKDYLLEPERLRNKYMKDQT
jgi:tRNA nucleotidyltransferase (CCA-adding enzyme)